MTTAKRRAHGTGCVAFVKRRQMWRARINFPDGRTRSRSCETKEQAEVAVRELRKQYLSELGYHYNGHTEYWYADRQPGRESRRDIGPKTRFDVLTRDAYRCQYCGAPAPEVRLHVDHIIPVIDGGSDDMDNLVTACQDCNLGKGRRPATPVRTGE